MTDDQVADLLTDNVRLRDQLSAVDGTAPGSHATLFVWAVIVLSMSALAALTTILIMRPEKDNTAIIATIVAFVVTIATPLLAAAVQQVHLAVNSRLSQLLALTAKASRAEGQLSGQAAGLAAGLTRTDATGTAVSP